MESAGLAPRAVAPPSAMVVPELSRPTLSSPSDHSSPSDREAEFARCSAGDMDHEALPAQAEVQQKALERQAKRARPGDPSKRRKRKEKVQDERAKKNAA